MDNDLELSAGRIHVTRGGEGPPLLLIHGWVVSGLYFRAVRPALEQRYTVYTLDLPGHGDSASPPPDRFAYDLPAFASLVTEAMDALSIPSARVWGHSMGGGVAMTLAARHPERVERLVLEDAAVYPFPFPLKGRLAFLPLVGRSLFTKLYMKRDLVNHLRSVHLDPRVATDEDVEYFWQRFNRPGAREALYASLTTLHSLTDDNADPANVKAPTLVLWGDSDPTVPPSRAERLAKAIPGARLEIVRACGHSPHEEKPDEALRAILPFLDGEAAAAAS